MNRLMRNPTVGLLVLCVVILAASCAGMLHLQPGIVSDAGWHLPMLVVALLFGLGEIFVLHVHVRRQRRSVSLSEIPLVLALFFATPYALVLGRVIGGGLVLTVLRKQRSAKLLLNMAVFIGESVAALLVFRALVPDDPDSPLAWLAAYVAVFAASCTSHTSVGLAIAMHNGALRLVTLLKDSLGGVAAALAVATFALVAETALAAEVRTAFLLVLVTGMLVVGYREYSRLSERHLALERLLRFGQVLAASPEVDEVLRSLLVQARELLRSEAAEVTFLPDGDGGQGLRVRLLPDDTLQRTVVDDLRASDPVSAEVVEHGSPVLLERGDEGAAPSEYLALRGQREAVLVPLKGDVGVVGTLAVADRVGEIGTFDRSDVDLLQTVADSAASALVKGQLMDQLRQDALHDTLTGLPNRAQLLQVLAASQDQAAAAPYGVLLLDLNGFKAVNDTLGHERGDVLLKDIARRRDAFGWRRQLAFRLYVTVVAVAGLGLLGALTVPLPPSDLLAPGAAFWLVCALLLVGELRPMLGLGGSDADGLLVTPALVFAVLLGHGVVAAVLLQAVATTVVDLVRRKALWRIGFNVGQYTLSWGACGLVMALLGHEATLREPASLDGPMLLAAVAGGLAAFVVNQALVTKALALRSGEGWWALTREDLAYETLTYGALLGMAPVIALAVERGALFVPLLVPPLLALYQVAGITAQREQQALTDPLTGLANRLRLREQAEGVLQDGAPAALVLFDLDRFKDVNDTLGHHVGDALLQVVARRLQGTVRPDDTVARLGGDEFAVLLPGCATDEAVAEAAQRMLAALAEPVVLEGLLVDVAASAGTALAPRDGADLDELLQHADVAMYLAKESGGGVQAYDAEQDHHSTARLALTGELRRALEHGELAVHYQPKACLRSGRVLGVEALVRWQHPERGNVPPDVFVPLAERSGLVQALTRWVLDTALAQVAAWRADGLELTVAVNVSVKDLCGGLLPDDVARALARHDLPADCLVLELTEGMLFADPVRATATLQRLHDAGVALSLDDFGTGWSSLGHLRDLPVHEVKIDRSFVMRMGEDARDLAIVRSVLDLARGMGMRVVAEGVEDEAGWSLLSELGCDTAQGWYLSKALPPAELAPLLARLATPVPAPRVADADVVVLVSAPAVRLP